MDATPPPVAPAPAGPMPANAPPSAPPVPRVTLDDLFPARVQAAFLVLLLGLVGMVAWISFRSNPNVAARPEPIPLPRPATVDLNRADRSELMLLPGVGPQLADRIILHRAANGSFDGLAELRNVPGVGPTMLEKLRPHLALTWPENPTGPRPGQPVLRAALAAYRKAAPPTSLDPNTATFDELQALPGIGPKLAQRMIEAREARPFAALADLRRVSGIGPKTLEKLKPHVSFGPDGAATARVQ